MSRRRRNERREKRRRVSLPAYSYTTYPSTPLVRAIARSTKKVRRVTPSNASWKLPHRPLYARSGPVLSVLEDRRTFRPEATPPLRGHRSVPRIVVPHGSNRALRFAAPGPILCQRRKARAEVLHATRKAGKRGQNSPRFTPWSHVSCK